MNLLFILNNYLKLILMICQFYWIMLRLLVVLIWFRTQVCRGHWEVWRSVKSVGQSIWYSAKRRKDLLSKGCLIESIGWRSQAQLYNRIGNIPKCLENYEECLKLNPKDAHVYFHQGSVYMFMNRMGDAMNSFKNAVDNDPNMAHAWLNLSLVQEALG